MRHVLRFVLVVFAFAALCAPASAVTNGFPDADHPYVGLLAEGVDGQFVEVCSGFLVSPRVLVTSAHCTAQIQDDGGTPVVSFAPVFDPSAELVSGVAVTDPDFVVTAKTVQNDLGVVLLDQAVTGVGSAQLPAAGLLDTLTKRGVNSRGLTIVGYGASGFTHGGGKPQPVFTDTRQMATTQLTNLKGALADGDNLRMSSSPSGVCFGDSGGPVLLGSSETVVGVTSFAVNRNCDGGAVAARLDTPAALGFLAPFL